MALVAVVAGLLAAPALASAACTGGSLYVVAHADDTILFQSPDILHEMRAGACVQTIIVTAGDDGADETYWANREYGTRAAYASMAGVANDWTLSTGQAGGHAVAHRELKDTNVSIDFIRLPDGGWPEGLGTATYGFQSVTGLWTGRNESVTPVDGTAAYTREGLIATLRDLIDEAQPTSIRTQDYLGTTGDTDHPDHHAVAWFTREAQEDYGAAHTLVSYDDYDTATRPENLEADDLAAKSSTFFVYAPFDRLVCQTPEACSQGPQSVYGAWLKRQYILDTQVYAGPPPVQDPAPTPEAAAITWPLPGTLVPGLGTPTTKAPSVARTPADRRRDARAQARLALWRVFGVGIKTPSVTCKLKSSTASTCTVSWHRKGYRYRGTLALRDATVKGRLRWQYRVDVKRTKGKHTTHIKRGYATGGIVSV